MATAHDWTKFQLEFVFPTEIETLFPYISTVNGFRAWLCDDCKITAADGHRRDDLEKIQTGDRINWVGPNGPKLQSHVLNLTSNSKLKLTYGLAEGIPVTVTLFLSPEGPATRLRAIEEQLGRSEDGRQKHELDRRFWESKLGNLRSKLEVDRRARVAAPEL